MIGNISIVATSSPVVWSMSAMVVTLIVDFVYMLIFLLGFGVIFWLVVMFFKPLIDFIRHGYN